MRKKKYPEWSDFGFDETVYGIGAPLVGCGIYTKDRLFSWPDRQCTTKAEYEAWVQHLTKNNYEIPEKYLNAYYQDPPDEPKL